MVAATPASLLALGVELKGLKLGALTSRARATEGISEIMVEEALDSDDPRGALSQIVQAAGPSDVLEGYGTCSPLAEGETYKLVVGGKTVMSSLRGDSFTSVKRAFQEVLDGTRLTLIGEPQPLDKYISLNSVVSWESCRHCRAVQGCAVQGCAVLSCAVPC